MNELTREFNELQQKLTQKDQEKESNFASIVSENNQYKAKINELKLNQQNLLNENDEYKKIIVKVQEDFKEMKKDYSQLKDLETKTAKEEAAKEKIIKRLKERIIELNEQNEEQINKIKVLQKQLETKSTSTSTTSNSSSLTQANRDLQIKLDSTSKENEQLKQILARVENDFKEMKKNYFQLKEIDNKSSIEEAAKENIIKKLKERIIELGQQNEELNRQLIAKPASSLISASKTSKSQQEKEMQQQIAEMKKVIDSISNENDEYKRIIERIEKDFNEMKNDYSQLKELEAKTAREEAAKEVIIKKLKERIVELQMQVNSKYYY